MIRGIIRYAPYSLTASGAINYGWLIAHNKCYVGNIFSGIWTMNGGCWYYESVWQITHKEKTLSCLRQMWVK